MRKFSVTFQDEPWRAMRPAAFSKESAALKIAIAADEIRKQGSAESAQSITFTPGEVQALNRLCRAAIKTPKRRAR